MSENIVMASKFKEKCLALLDQVARTKVPLTVTKRGRPVARVIPMDDVQPHRSTKGSVRLLKKGDAAYFSTGETWEVDEPQSR